MAVAAVLLCTLGACSDDPESDATTESTPSASESTSASTPSPSPTPSEPAGELVEGTGFSLRAPVTWEVRPRDRGESTLVTMHAPPGSADLGSIGVYIDPGNPSSVTLESLETSWLKNTRVKDPQARKLARTTIAGASAYHVQGSDGPRHFDSYGAVRNGVVITIDFELGGSKAHRQSIIDEVLGSAEWH